MNIFKRIIRHYKHKYALYCVNKKYCGTNPKFFDKKLKALRAIGYKIGDNTKIVGPIACTCDLTIGKNCWIGKNFSCDGNGVVIIGDNVDIAPNVVINTGGHLIGQESRRAGEGVIRKITIGDGTWIGTNVTIINDTNIGKGNVVAAGSVVINSSNDNVLLAGVPAKEKRSLNE